MKAFQEARIVSSTGVVTLEVTSEEIEEAVLTAAASLVRARRGVHLTGVRRGRCEATSQLLSAPTDERGYVKITGIKQVDFKKKQHVRLYDNNETHDVVYKVISYCH